jgi:hypothetical protein
MVQEKGGLTIFGGLFAAKRRRAGHSEGTTNYL